jgi:hypothetical protein
MEVGLKAPVYFFASFSVPIYGNIIALCNQHVVLQIKALYNPLMMPAFPSKVYRT